MLLKQFIFPVLVIATVAACDNDKKETPKEPVSPNTTAVQATTVVFDKLVGTWQSPDGKSFERWTKNDDGTFRSAAFSVKGTDTSWNEQASVYKSGDQWVFENTVKNQNEGKSVKFISSSITGNSVQFSNPAHDFPTDIHYSIPHADTVKAFIVGPNAKGGKDTIPFYYSRLK